MSTEATTATFRYSASTGAARLVLLAMADEASSDGYITAYRRSQSWFASKANVDERTVRRAIDRLVELGEVEVLAVGTGRERSDYRIVLPGLGEGEPPAPRPEPEGGRAARPARAHRPPREGTPPAPSPRSAPVNPVDPPVAPPGQLALVPDQPPPAAPARRPPQGQLLGFDAFWREYPRKVGKPSARRAWDKAIRRADAARIIAAAAAFAADPNREAQYTAHPSTWLNDDRWEAGPLPERGGGGVVGRARRVAAALDGMRPGDGGRPAPVLGGQAARVAAMLESANTQVVQSAHAQLQAGQP